MLNSYPNPPLPPFEDFESASRAILHHLQSKIGFKLWMMTRKEGKDWIILHVCDQGYEVPEGTVYRWADSFCSRMVKGQGPRIAPVSTAIPAYRDAPIAEQVSIGAYIGVPVVRTDGSLFGTLCAIDPEPADTMIESHLNEIELLSQCLSTILNNELAMIEQARELERSQVEAATDHLTGLVNRRGWEKSIQKEEARAKRYGNPVSVFMIDLDNLKEVNDREGHAGGDALIKRAADCLRSSVRESDLVARLGGDEFGILAVECNKKGAEALYTTLEKNLISQGISASIGHAQRRSPQHLDAVIARADANMYQEKKSHHKNN